MVWCNSECTFLNTVILLLLRGTSHQLQIRALLYFKVSRMLWILLCPCAFTCTGPGLLSSLISKLIKYVVISDTRWQAVCPWGNLPVVASPSLPIPHKGQNIQCSWQLSLLVNPLPHKTLGSESEKDLFRHTVLSVSCAVLPTIIPAKPFWNAAPCCGFLKFLCQANLRRVSGGKSSKNIPQEEGNTQLWCSAKLCNQCFKDGGKQLKILTGERQSCSSESWVTQNKKHCNYLLLNLILQTDGVPFPPPNALLTWLENHFWAFTPNPVA